MEAIRILKKNDLNTCRLVFFPKHNAHRTYKSYRTINRISVAYIVFNLFSFYGAQIINFFRSKLNKNCTFVTSTVKRF